MSRWTLVLLLGWVLYGGLLARYDQAVAEREAAEWRACQCTKAASVQPLVGSGRPLSEQLAERLRPLVGSESRGSTEALRLHGLQLRVADGAIRPPVDLDLSAELPRGTVGLAFLFETRSSSADGEQRIEYAVALAPVGELAALGKERCRTELPIRRGDRVTAAVAAVDAAGNLGPASTVEAVLAERSDRLARCEARRYGCGLGAMARLFLGACWAFGSFLVLVAGLMTTWGRRALFRAARPEPLPLGALDRLCTHARREQLAYLVLSLLCGAALALRYPASAAFALPMLPLALLAAWRYRALHRLQRAAEQPDASYHRQGPGIVAMHDGKGHQLLFRPKAVDAVMSNCLPPMRAR